LTHHCESRSYQVTCSLWILIFKHIIFKIHSGHYPKIIWIPSIIIMDNHECRARTKISISEIFQSRKNFHLPSRENVFIHEEVVMTSWHANLNHLPFTLPTLLENKTSRLVEYRQNTDRQTDKPNHKAGLLPAKNWGFIKTKISRVRMKSFWKMTIRQRGYTSEHLTGSYDSSILWDTKRMRRHTPIHLFCTVM
jgi:hypothetical protein